MSSRSPDRSPAFHLQRRASEAGLSLTGTLTDLLTGAWSDAHGRVQHTLLAVCPNSEVVTRAALQAAQQARAPLLFAATLNQVDRDGGYTGWTPDAFARFVNREVERLVVDVPVVLGLDHGGPWKKDHHVHQDLDYETAFREAETSITACLDAGYDLLHLDPTADRRLPPGQPVAIDDLVDRTVRLLRHAEAYRTEHGLSPRAYEVGTEESGGLQSEDRFCAFLGQLADALDDHDLPRPSFVVGDVGTRLDTAHVNVVRTERLATEARRQIGALLKGHYTDEVEHLEVYPLTGVGGANVGPGLSAAEYDALVDLVGLERRLDRDSGFREAMRAAVVESDRWRKWLHPEERGLDFGRLTPERRQWLVRTGSRYVWTDPDVQAARSRLYDHVRPYRDADDFVHWRVRSAILRYLYAFNLTGLADRIGDGVGKDGGGVSERGRG